MKTNGKCNFIETTKGVCKKTRENVTVVWDWCRKNPVVAISLTLTALGLAADCGKAVQVSRDRKADRNIRERTVYDRRHGHSYQLNRPMSSAEYVEYDLRYDNGESAGKILSDMGVLK